MKMKRLLKRIAMIISAAVLCAFTLFEGFAAPKAFADEADNLQEEFEQINVLDDLKNTTIGDSKFSLIDYNFDESKKLQIFSFVEFCYSFYADNQQDYGLYLYIYNPQGLKFEQNSPLHAVTIRHGNDTSKNFTKYRMQFLNCSQGDYFGLFYKFKVVLSDTQKTEILQGDYKVNSSERQYEIGEIELKRTSETNADSYRVGTVYKFSGYAKGYGADETADSTLSMLTAGGQEVISLNVKPTFYRPDGTNGKNDYTQDSLHSVYFAVPNHYIDKYGEMYAVHATWLNAVLKPMLVTGNQGAYNAIKNYLGVDLNTVAGNEHGGNIEDIGYLYLGGLTYKPGADGGYDQYGYGYSYNFNTVHGSALSHDYYGDVINPLYGLFYAGTGTDSADNCIVSSEEIYEEIKKSKELYGGELVNGKFSKDLFESIDDKFTEVNLSRDDMTLGKSFLTSQKFTQSFWQKIYGTKSYTVPEYTEKISVIEEVTDEKMKGDFKSVCDRLYVFENDFDDFKSYYNKYAKSENNDYNEKCTVYLFRYMVTDYIAQEATALKFNGKKWERQDTNARFFQETVNLDFDIIDLTFVKDDIYTVIPVAMSPIDIIHDSTRAVYTKSDKDNDKDWLKIILGILLLIVLLVILMPILPTLISVLLQIVMLPFKLIGAIFKGISKAFHKRE